MEEFTQQEKEMDFEKEELKDVEDLIDGIWAFQSFHPAGCKQLPECYTEHVIFEKAEDQPENFRIFNTEINMNGICEDYRHYQFFNMKKTWF